MPNNAHAPRQDYININYTQNDNRDQRLAGLCTSAPDLGYEDNYQGQNLRGYAPQNQQPHYYQPELSSSGGSESKESGTNSNPYQPQRYMEQARQPIEVNFDRHYDYDPYYPQQGDYVDQYSDQIS